MNCNCIKEIETTCFKKTQDLQKENLKHLRKTVEKATFRDTCWPIINNTMTSRTCNTVEIKLEGQKKKKTMTAMHTFCPFCGVKYGQTDQEEEDHH
ncbi:hypothetical protein KAR91_30815 [Candidatus Pacearchaeota archaeon]|nr:hypothetical protein [Candidatus Pacearchaeota archaeon]